MNQMISHSSKNDCNIIDCVRVCVCVCARTRVFQSLNQVVLWDKIVLRGENTKLNLKDMKSKYFFFDDGNGLRLDPQRHTRSYFTAFTLCS